MTNVETRARATDPDTSHEAVPDQLSLGKQQARVLVALSDASARHVDGNCTVSECVVRMAVNDLHLATPQRNIVGRRITDLVELGLVGDTGARRMASTGRRQVAWLVTAKGEQRASLLRLRS